MTRSTLEVRDDGRMVAETRDVRDELKRRAGAYELLPSNRGSLVLRRQGQAAGGEFWVSGEITRLGGLWGVLAVAAHSGWRGELVVAAKDGPRRSLFIEHGAVVSALSEASTERLGAVLERSGALTPSSPSPLASTLRIARARPRRAAVSSAFSASIRPATPAAKGLAMLVPVFSTQGAPGVPAR